MPDDVVMYAMCNRRLASLETGSGRDLAVDKPGRVDMVVDLRSVFGVRVCDADGGSNRWSIYRPRTAQPMATVDNALWMSEVIDGTVLYSAFRKRGRRVIVHDLATGTETTIDATAGSDTPTFDAFSNSRVNSSARSRTALNRMIGC